MRLLLCLLAVAGCRPAPPAPVSSAPVPSADSSPGAETFRLLDPAPLGVVDGIAFLEGGISGLDLDPDGGFVAVTDRGPNADALNAAGRPAKRFPLPGYRPSLLRLSLTDAGLRLDERHPFTLSSTVTASGLPVPDQAGAVIESAFGPGGEMLAPDTWGIDAEGIAAVEDGYWVSEEYRPSIWRVGRDGTVRARYTPTPVDARDRLLPTVVLEREANRGFEGIGVWPSGRVVAALQSPLLLGDDSRIARLVVLEPETGDSWTLAYELDGPLRKIGDVAALDEGRLLVIEHGPLELGGAWSGQVYLLDTRRADRVPDDAVPEADPSSVRLAAKSMILDLSSSGWPVGLEKPEGLAVLDDRTLAIVNDNDYGLDSPLGDGAFVATGQGTVLVRFQLVAPLLGVGGSPPTRR